MLRLSLLFTLAIGLTHGDLLPNDYIYDVPSGNNPFEVINEWKYLDFEYDTYSQRQKAIKEGSFIPENNLPLGVDVYGDRIFITTPRWKDGVPASFGTLKYPPAERSPAIRPYPSLAMHADPYNPDCSKLVSLYRTAIDSCGRLWAIDSGVVNATVSLNQICPPKILVFDLSSDTLILSYEIPSDQVMQGSLLTNIVVNVQHNRCSDAFAYVADVWRFGLIVFSLRVQRSWRIMNYNFLPNPVATDFNVYGLNFQWSDGVFGMSLYPTNNNDHILYFHPMASFKEFAVAASILNNEGLWLNPPANISKYFIEIGDRGSFGQSSTSGITDDGIMFFTQVHRDDVACWDTGKPYTRANLKLLINGAEPTVNFPNDLKVIREGVETQGVWVVSNRLPIYLYSKLNYTEINFRILRADVNRAIANTICDPATKAILTISTAKVNEGQCF